MALKLPRKFNSQLEMYRARVGDTRIDEAEGNVGERQGRRIAGPLRAHLNAQTRTSLFNSHTYGNACQSNRKMGGFCTSFANNYIAIRTITEEWTDQ